MAGKLFYRERRKYVDGSKTPRYQLAAVAGVDLKVYGKHLRMSELRHIAETVGAELVLLPRGPKHQGEEEEEIEV
ncbi:hypothetical protein DESUT3_35260 [Desulfuromonas versatilis]|uniref:Uncharacterized protein n=1 Tax=Desulfuromonas versatilis TaxID=2802975 RepID=A0ABN6E2P1_9BACT|nr:hypothetical protein [Desulfuromonas versatilis]BCR06457.1 hypothetical protein DESUT3_35260 [Desulfuromonas versatilis]